ncbi:hypothetical protein BDA96_04G066900 [Sorghum bicolor]|uniref:Uncharacterized protein n=2 Tax=Sorghum bicolor TaxID=4558 RepID=A0A921R104_SORBI|nr:hypothetical protein BDA96_04G066900 [Sorghum bicolor]KAG0531960.1 hypothetical protein BDA96_04G066900 [Sorghum bicolor]KXG29599.1 hypothetical protein SORBI_3004G061600 [Sorghum bicolor]
MAWWRAWLAVVAARVRRRKGRTGRAGIVDLHKDVETCGYHDVQVMWDMLGLDTGPPSSAPERRKRSPFWTWTPSFWHFRSSRRAATAAAR